MDNPGGRTAVEDVSVRDMYDVGELIGAGSFGTVRHCTRRETGEAFALKTVDSHNTSRGDLVRIHNQVKIMTSLSHPHIVAFVEVFETPRHLYIVMDLCEGGELLERLVQRGHFAETDACTIMAKIFETLKYLHEHSVVHRDLKPENILLEDAEDLNTLKITDFGVAAMVDEAQLMATMCGSPQYVAPEILGGQVYDSSVDLWSAGVVMYLLLTGEFPFASETPSELYEAILEGSFHFPALDDRIQVSPLAQDMIEHLLVVAPSDRYTAIQALDHSWIAGDVASVEPEPGLLEMIRAFNAERRFRKAAHAVIASERLMSTINYRKRGSAGADEAEGSGGSGEVSGGVA